MKIDGRTVRIGLTACVLCLGSIAIYSVLATPQIELKSTYVQVNSKTGSGVIELTNSGRGSLQIQKLASSCSCANAEIDKKILEPGEAANINVTLSGKSNASIAIFSNDPKNRCVFVKVGLSPPMSPPAFPPAQFGWFFVIMGGFLFVLGQTFSVFVLVSGRFIGQTKNRLFSFVIACVLCMFISFGTVLGVFTIIVLSRDSVKELYASKKQLAG